MGIPSSHSPVLFNAFLAPYLPLHPTSPEKHLGFPRISADFIFGRYSSVHSIVEHFFKTSNPVTISGLMCPNRHEVANIQQSQTSSCEIIVFAQPGSESSLQHCVDNFTHSTASRCLTCDSCLLQSTSFVQTPPIMVFDLGECVPSLSSILRITSGENIHVSYNLRGIIYYKDQHFTSRFITRTSMIWFHDGMFTGNSLIYEGQNIDSITTETAVMAFYTLQ